MRDLPTRAHRRKRQDRRIREDNRADGVAQRSRRNDGGLDLYIQPGGAAPPALLPVTVYTAALVTVVGVPLITPDCGSSSSPAGSLGATVYSVMAPPLLCGTFGMIATPLVYTTEVSR